jgi:hypothetical protein
MWCWGAQSLAYAKQVLCPLSLAPTSTCKFYILKSLEYMFTMFSISLERPKGWPSVSIFPSMHTGVLMFLSQTDLNLHLGSATL